MTMPRLSVCVFCFAFVLCTPIAVEARVCQGIELSEAVLTEGRVLRLNGLGVRRATALRVKVVLAGLYLETPTRDADQAIASAQSKRLDLHFLRRVSHEDIVRVLERGIRVNAPHLSEAVRDELAALDFVLPDGRDGRVFSFVGLPSGETRVLVDGVRLTTFEDPRVMPALLSIFLGPEPGNDAIRAALLGTTACR